jgi:hypothetical protein
MRSVSSIMHGMGINKGNLKCIYTLLREMMLQIKKSNFVAFQLSTFVTTTLYEKKFDNYTYSFHSRVIEYVYI